MKDDLRSALIEQIARLPVEAVLALIRLIAEALISDDPLRVIERRASADAAHAAAQHTADQILQRKK